MLPWIMMMMIEQESDQSDNGWMPIICKLSDIYMPVQNFHRTSIQQFTVLVEHLKSQKRDIYLLIYK